MQALTTCLWFNDNIEEALDLYREVFGSLETELTTRYGDKGAEVSGRPKGSLMTVKFKLCGRDFLALNGGPIYSFTPAISLFVSCKDEADIDRIFAKLSGDGKGVLMPLQKYPFSEKYAWINDRFGLSWQLNLDGRERRIAPALMFTGDQNGKAEEAIKFYVSFLPNSQVGEMHRYQPGEGGTDGTLKHARFKLAGDDFVALDSSMPHGFNFTPATSFIVDCDNQAELDQFWSKLEQGGSNQQCGWITDKFGISWQVVPSILPDLLHGGAPEKSEHVMEALMQMKKIEIDKLQEAFAR